jgi:hypothetical protein
LAVAAALVHARRVGGKHVRQQVEAIEVRRGARVGNRAGGEEKLGGSRRRTVQRVEAARPPFAAPIWIGPQLEQRAGDIGVVCLNESWRVEIEDRFVDDAA